MSNLKQIKDDDLTALSERLLTVDEGAKLLRCARQSIYNAQSVGKMKRIKLGSRTFCDRDEVEQMLRQALGG